MEGISAGWRKSSYSTNNGGQCVEVTSWRKASYSGANGGGCVEVASWRKASYSTNNGGACVEAGVVEAGRVLVRDTTDRDGGTLSFTTAAWRAFAAALKQRHSN
jgi:Domain of unknown function (DUF397)